MEKMEKINLLKRFIKENGIKQVELSERMGVKQSQISDMINGKRDPGRLLMFLNKNYGATFEAEATESTSPHNIPGMLPEVSFRFAAGQRQLITEREKINRHWYFPDCTDCDAVVPIEGDSMMPNMPPGSFAVLKRFYVTANNPNSIPFGQVFGIVVEDEATGDYHGYVKVLRKHKDAETAKQCWIAHSFNPDYDDFDIHLSQVRSLWIVKQYVVSSMAY